MAINRDMLRTALSLATDWPKLTSDDIADAVEAAYDIYPPETHDQPQHTRCRFDVATGFCQSRDQGRKAGLVAR